MAYWNQGNYPPNQGYGNYPAPSSGPPPPPGAPGYGGYSAYNVNQYPQYGGYPGYAPPPQAGYGYPQQPYGQQQPYGYQQPGYGQPPPQGGAAVAGFTAPAPGQAPPAMAYNQAANMMSHYSHQRAQWQNFKQMGLMSDSEDEDAVEKQRQKQRRRRRKEQDDDYEESDDEDDRKAMAARMRRAEEKARQLQEKLESDDGLKRELRDRFIDELLRRQTVSGTFEETHGTIYPIVKYDEDDLVRIWFNEKKGSDILGEKWDALLDAEYLRHAVKGFGTDEKAIISVVTTRSNSQRNKIMTDYKTAYGRDLMKDLKGDLSGNFEEVVIALFETPARYDAWALKKAIYGAGTNERTLIEILMTRTNAQLQETVQEYDSITYGKQKKSSSSLERDIKGDCSGDFKRLLISAAQGNRRLIDREQLDESVEAVENDGKWTGMFHVNYAKLCNESKCQRMAQELFDAGEDKWGTDEETFNRIFSTQDYYTLRLIWDEYVKISQRDILNAVDKETSGDYKRGLKAVAQSIKCRPMFFVERLAKSMKGLGTDDSTLIRVIISRSEIDLLEIKAMFLEKHGKTLWKYIHHDTSGDYRRILEAIVGKN